MKKVLVSSPPISFLYDIEKIALDWLWLIGLQKRTYNIGHISSKKKCVFIPRAFISQFSQLFYWIKAQKYQILKLRLPDCPTFNMSWLFVQNLILTIFTDFQFLDYRICFNGKKNSKNMGSNFMLYNSKTWISF